MKITLKKGTPKKTGYYLMKYLQSGGPHFVLFQIEIGGQAVVHTERGIVAAPKNAWWSDEIEFGF